MAVFCPHCGSELTPRAVDCQSCGGSLTGPGSVTVGRDPSNLLVLHHPSVSARHALVSRHESGNLLVVDLGSRNGTFVDGKRIDRALVTLGDDVRLGTAALPTSHPAVAGLLVHVVRAPRPGRPAVIGSGPEADVVIRHPDVPLRYGELHVGRDGGFAIAVDPPPHVGAAQRPAPAPISPTSVLRIGAFALPSAALVRLVGQEPTTTMVRLDGPDETPARRPVVVGRDPGIGLRLAHPSVSRRHARVTPQAGGAVLVEDLGSRNGTFVEGRRVPPEGMLADAGHRIVVGAVELVVLPEGRVVEAGRAEVRIDLVGVGLSVPDRSTGKPRALLDDVTLSIAPGELVALLGPSGAGKSTLLQTVLGVARPTSGRVLVNGEPLAKNLEAFRSNLGYVPQDDIVHPELTVAEALRYACRLRLPAETTVEEIEAAIDRTLAEVGLVEQRDLVIGSPEDKVLSGGQRRRVNLAVELVTDPTVLVLDEPTSGLGWTDAAEVVATLRRLADAGRTVLVTIHQPDVQEYESFDVVAILARGGKLAFYGPPRPDSYDFFGAERGRPRAIFDRLDAADPEYLRRLYSVTDTRRRYVEERLAGLDAANAAVLPEVRERARTRELVTLLSRTFRITLRQRAAVLLLLLQAPLLALLIGLAANGAPSARIRSFGCSDASDFVDACEDSRPALACDPRVVAAHPEARAPSEEAATQRVRDPRTGLLAVLMAVFLPMVIASANALVGERAIFTRERLAGLGLVPYVLARFVVLASLGAVTSTLHVLVAIPRLGLEGPVRSYVAIGILVSASAAALGLVLSAAVRRPVAALWGVNLLVIPQLLLAGSITRLEGVLSTASHLTATRPALEALVRVDLDARTVLDACQVRRYVEALPGFDGSIRDPVGHASVALVLLTLACLATTVLVLVLREREPRARGPRPGSTAAA
ncbi:MAG: ATP-binding cassette domain-containing protein [Polyangiales bacterium]